MNNPQPIYFPPGVVEQNGRRIRPGSVVQFKNTYEDSAEPVLGEVVGWCSDGIIIVDDQDIPNQYVINPIDCQLVDEHSLVSLTAGTYVVEFSDRPTSLVYPVGGRDILVDGQEFPRENLRESSLTLLVDLQKRDHNDALDWVKEHLSAPILERVLIEAALPSQIETIFLVVTDQSNNRVDDTLHIGELLRFWIEANGHLNNTEYLDEDRRWIRNIETFTINYLPHVVDATLHQVMRLMPIAFSDNHRLAIASPGGTPATNTALLVAAVLYSRTQFKELNETSRTNLVRHIHVPGPNAQNQTQSLIEFDADDLQWLSKLKTTD